MNRDRNTSSESKFRAYVSSNFWWHRRYEKCFSVGKFTVRSFYSGIDISRLALRYSFDEVSADVVLCGTARVNELEENIKNAQTPLTNEEKEAQAKILEKLKDVQGHWEGKEIKAYWNRINGVEDDLPYFRDWKSNEIKKLSI